MSHLMPHVTVTICITAVSCAREQSKMVAFTKRSSHVRGNTSSKRTRDTSGQHDKQGSRSGQDAGRHYYNSEI